MKRDTNRPKSSADTRNRTAHVGSLWNWAYAAEQADNPLAESVRVLLEECKRLADLVPTVERLKADAANMVAAVESYERENARLRALLNRPAPAA